MFAPDWDWVMYYACTRSGRGRGADQRKKEPWVTFQRYQIIIWCLAMCLCHRVKYSSHSQGHHASLHLNLQLIMQLLFFAHKNIQNYLRPAHNYFISSASVQCNICGWYCDRLSWISWSSNLFWEFFTPLQSGKQILYFPDSLAPRFWMSLRLCQTEALVGNLNLELS